LYWNYIFGSIKQDMYKEYGHGNALQRIYFSELGTEIIIWEIAMKKATEIS
jgi:hypothetical protein